MRKSLKSALLSALVFPGSGHFFLQKYVRATLLAAVAAVCVYLLFSTSMEVAQAISTKIQSGEIPLDITQISAAIADQSAGNSAELLNRATWVFSLCWFVSIIDSYRVGRLHDKTVEG